MLRQFSVPGLLIFGEQETLYKPEPIVKRAKRLMPHLETNIIQGAGHAAIYDRPDAANKAVLDFLRKPLD